MKKCLLAVALLFGSDHLVFDAIRNVEATMEFPDIIGNKKVDLLRIFFKPLVEKIRKKEINDQNISNYVPAPLGTSIKTDFEKVKKDMSQKYFERDDVPLSTSLQMMTVLADSTIDGEAKGSAMAVGRVEIQGGYTGTGTLVRWTGMPTALENRVVITCGHNNPLWTGQKPQPGHAKEIASFGTGTAATTMSVYENPEGLHFTYDPSSEVWEPNAIERTSIAVARCYNYREHGKTAENGVVDFAVLILKEPVAGPEGVVAMPLDHVLCSQASEGACPDLQFAGDHCRSIGYGGVGMDIAGSPALANFTGWNLKKLTRTFGPPVRGETGWATRYNYPSATGPSDSGSPVMMDLLPGYGKIVGIVTGSSTCVPIAAQKDRILNAVRHYLGLPIPTALPIDNTGIPHTLAADHPYVNSEESCGSDQDPTTASSVTQNSSEKPACTQFPPMPTDVREYIERRRQDRRNQEFCAEAAGYGYIVQPMLQYARQLNEYMQAKDRAISIEDVYQYTTSRTWGSLDNDVKSNLRYLAEFTREDDWILCPGGWTAVKNKLNRLGNYFKEIARQPQ
ncbi:hypothetical protein FACS189472_02200 [Alphaproteobacteria bacterium]|nr:hypothetical protein FACS189472_02200 [Alphaproteobacteria bacterium]